MNEIVLPKENVTDNRRAKLLFGILFDAIGYLSYLIPLAGEFSDIIWAPLAGLLLKSMYKGTVGTVGGIFAFIEEAVPGLDFIPTFTLTWLYTYVYKKQTN